MTRLTRSRVAATAGLALGTTALGLAVAPAALAVGSGLPALVGPHTAVVGEAFEVTGTDCDAPEGKTAIAYVDVYSVADLESDGESAEPLFGDEFPVVSGDWEASVLFGELAPAGDYVLWASCESYAGAGLTDYPEFAIALSAASVTPAPPAQPSVPPVPSTPPAAPVDLQAPTTVQGVEANTPGVGPVASSAATTDTTPAPGQKVVKVYKGFQPFEVVTLTMHSTPVTLGEFTADANGVVTVEYTVPAGADAGTHTLVLSGDAGTYFQESITVAAGTAVTEAGSNGLAYTGADVAVPLALGGGLLALGGGALLVSRRRAGATQA
jgi:hypothetical protein